MQYILKGVYSLYFKFRYSSSNTASHHSVPVSSPGTSTAKCANQLSRAAPCQCFTSSGMTTTLPGWSSCTSFPHSLRFHFKAPPFYLSNLRFSASAVTGNREQYTISISLSYVLLTFMPKSVYCSSNTSIRKLS